MMAPEKVAAMAHYFDMLVKAIIAIVLSLAGYQFKRLGDTVDLVQNENAKQESRIAVLESNMVHSQKQLERIEIKVDKVLDKVRQ